MTTKPKQKYPFKTKPFQHQIDALRTMWGKPAFALLMEQGTGKTKVTIDEAGALFIAGRLKRLLVLAPNGVHANWEDEIETHLPESIKRDVLVWNSGMTGKAWKTHQEQFLRSPPADTFSILLMNIEGMVSSRAYDLALEFMKQPLAGMIVDESSRIKNHKAGRTKKTTALGELACHKRILTGTPISQGPLDVFGQFNFLSPQLLGTKSFHVFKHRYAIWSLERNPQSGARFEKLVEYKDLDHLQMKIAPHSFRVTKEDCLDLPEKLYTIHRVGMSKPQAKVYEAMKEELLYEIDREDLAPANTLVKLLRLQQIVGGFLPKEGEEDKSAVEAIEGVNPKMALLLELMESLPGKAIVWARFRSELEAIEKALRKAHGRDAVVSYHGGITDLDQRRNAVKSFQVPESNPRFFVANPQAGGIGLQLTAATTVVYFSNDFSLETRLQSEDRAHRIGQTSNVQYIDLVARDSIDEQILGALRSKRSIADLMTAPDALRRIREMLT
jgi:SNF2 family DNA or RNA helicase